MTQPPVAYGEPLDGIEVVDVPAPVAPLFADAHARLRSEAVGVHLGDGAVRVVHPSPTGPGGGSDRWVPPSDEVVEALRSAERPVVLAGPGVVRHDAVPGLHALAAAAGLGVLNTWGAKGVFDWRSRHHLATAGLQADDFALAGLADADLIVATGVDPREATGEWRLAPVVEVHPWSLAPLAERTGRPSAEITMPPLRDGLARVTQQGWAHEGAPAMPTQVTRNYGAALAGVGVVAADPGVAGYWVARTLPTSGLRGALVSSDAAALGSAVATAAVARLLDPRRPVLAVVDEIGEPARRCLDAAARLGVVVPVERWVVAGADAAGGGAGAAIDAAAHARRLAGLLASGGTAAIAPEGGQLDQMLAVAGPITAWTR